MLFSLSALQKQHMSISTQVAGCCLFNAILAVILVMVGGKVAYSHAFWGAAAYISLWIVPKVGSPTLICLVRNWLVTAVTVIVVTYSDLWKALVHTTSPALYGSGNCYSSAPLRQSFVS